MPEFLGVDVYTPSMGWICHHHLEDEPELLREATRYADVHGDSDRPVSKWRHSEAAAELLDTAVSTCEHSLLGDRHLYERLSFSVAAPGSPQAETLAERVMQADQRYTAQLNAQLPLTAEWFVASMNSAESLENFPPGPGDDAEMYALLALAVREGILEPTHGFREGCRVFKSLVSSTERSPRDGAVAHGGTCHDHDTG